MTDTASSPFPAAERAAVPRILLAARDPHVCSNVHTLLQSGALVDIAVETGGRDAVVRAAGDFCPDIIILGEAVAGDDPYDVVRALRDQCDDTHIVLIGKPKDMADDVHWKLAVRAAMGFLELLAAPGEDDELAKRLSTAHATADQAAALPSGGGAIRINVLTSREREVLQQVADGLSSKEIAGRLSISVRTVESHRNQIMNKLQLRSIASLTKYAVRYGLSTL